ncbi:MAG: flagellin [Alphaproteobacteria bacterium CG_4_9_14_3_um_filter_47_13]|nr:MAG: flagellin [Alphaproteobacteria bacterium CG_4_9_14_3_um_filter_47_13]
MTSDVVLTSALRSNLLSLQNTQSAIDKTQFHLSSGRKINSALDGPQAFFASKTLNNRAGDLTRLLDGIGQSIQTIKAADNGVTALTSLVEQADSIATSAKDALAAGQVEAKLTGDVDLSGIDDLASVNGIANTDTFILTVTKEDGTAINIGAYGGAAAATATITINTNDSIDELLAEINNIALQVNGAGNAIGDQAFEASLDAGGNLSIKTLNGGNFNINFVSAAATDVGNLALAQALGFGDIARTLVDAGAGTNNVEATAIADVALRSFALYDSAPTPDTLATRGDIISALADEDGNALFANINSANDEYIIGINGGTAQDIALFQNGGAVTIQEFIDQINNNASLNTKIQADFDDATGQVIIRAISSDVQSIEIGLQDNNEIGTANFGFGVNADITATATDGERESIHLASAAGDLAQLEGDYNRVLAQITELVTNGDTAYRGTNLLNGDNLIINFNEGRTSSLTSFGSTFTSDGLGLSAANFARSSSVDDIIDQARTALESIRTFGSTLANDLAVIQTRETFTKSTINTLTEGADKLTIADQNEEGAKLLSLQTRQQLGVTALSLASQSQQSILRLF